MRLPTQDSDSSERNQKQTLNLSDKLMRLWIRQRANSQNKMIKPAGILKRNPISAIDFQLRIQISLIHDRYRMNFSQVSYRLSLISDIRICKIYFCAQAKNLGMTQKEVKQSIDDKLIHAAGALDLEQVKKLLKQGANPKYIRYSDPNAWYSGNTDTALYVATHANFKQKGGEQNYVNVLQTLLKAGSDPNFKATRGNWNHATSYPLFSNIYNNLNNISDTKEKIRFIQLFIKYGVNINQAENHGRSKNWRGYRTHTCFIFQAMSGCGVQCKIEELKKKYQTLDFAKLNKQKQNRLHQEFVKQFLEMKQQLANEQEQQQEEQKEQQENLQKKVPEVSFLEALINLGASPDSYASQSFWQNYENQNYEGQEDYKTYAKFDQTINQVHETILHRAIMNDLPGLVKLLLEKGAKVDTKLKFTVTSALYPHQWPQPVKQKKKKKIMESLQQYQTQKEQLLEQLKGQPTQQDKKDIQRDLRYYSFEIFKAKRFNIQNQLPQPTYQVKQLSCLEVAQAFKVSPEIIELIKQSNVKAQSK